MKPLTKSPAVHASAIHSQRMQSLAKSSARLIGFLLAASVGTGSAFAGNLYWKTNAAAIGAGSSTPSGIWGADDFWSAALSGAAALGPWTSGETAVFSAGSDASGAFIISLNGNQAAGGLTFEEGQATLSGGGLVLNGAGVVTVSGSALGSLSTPISGSAGLTKKGSGELQLSGLNTFTGGLTNQAGTLTLGNDQSAGAGSIVLNPSAAVFLRASPSVLTLMNDVSMVGSTSSIDVNADAGKKLVLNGIISGSHPWNVNSSGTVVLGGTSGFNTFSGALQVKQGTLVVAKDQALGGIVNSTVVASGATLSFDGGFEYTAPYGAKNIIVNGPGFGGGAALNNVSGDNIFVGTVTLAANSSVGADAGSLVLNGPVTGSFNLTKLGSGAVDLIGTGNNYSSTIISQGSLGVYGSSVAGSGLVTVNSGATFTGDGSAPGGVTVFGSIAPITTLDSGSQTWNGGGSYYWTINDAILGSAGALDGWDLINITGGLTMNATSGNKFNLRVISLSPDDLSPGDAAFFNTQQYDWPIVSTTAGLMNFDSTAFTIDDSNFSNDLGGGRFLLLQSGNNLVLRFDPKPVITATDIEENNTPNFCGASVTFAASVSDNQSGTVLAYATNGVSITSPCYFPVGTVVVDVVATDSVGNTNATSFSVTVNDAQPPTVQTQNATVALNGSGSSSILPGDVDNGSFDNCAVVSRSVVPDSFSCSNLGPNPVSLIVTDIHGNSATNTAVVTVVDTIAPTVLTQNITVPLDSFGSASITAAMVDNGSGDNCAIASRTVVPNAFTSINVGTNIVQLIATDTSGNQASNTAMVVIQDVTAPVVAANSIDVSLNESGNYTLTPSDISAIALGSTDACGISSQTVTPSVFDCSDVGTNAVTLVVTDVNGNAATNTTTVVVNDNHFPSLTSNPITITLDAAGNYTFTEADIATLVAGADDNCGVVATNVSPSTFTFCDVGTPIVLLTVTDVHGNATTNFPTVTVQAPTSAPSVVYVDASYGNACGAVTFPNSGGTGTNYIGLNAFSKVQDGLDHVAAGGTVKVAAGDYVESIAVEKAVSLLGPNAGLNPNTSSRSSEATIFPANSDPDPYSDTAATVIYVATNSVTIDGFTIDGDNVSLTSGFTLGGADLDASEAIAGYEGVSDIAVRNNVIRNTAYCGVDFDNYFDTAATAGNFIQDNKIQNIGCASFGFGIGIVLYDNFYADVSGNVMTDVRVGVQTGNFWRASSGSTQSIHDNTISSTRLGIFYNLHYSTASPFSIQNNAITAQNDASVSRWDGIMVSSQQGAVTSAISDNIINGAGVTQPTVGYQVWNCPANAGAVISGGTVAGCTYGAWVNNFDGYSSSGNSSVMTLDAVQISGATGAAVYVKDNVSNNNAATVHALLRNNCVISNSSIALLVDGPDASAEPGNSALSSMAVNYITLTNGSTAGVDAVATIFDGKAGSAMTLGELFGVENAVYHVLDDASLGLVRVKAGNVYVTTASGSVQRGVNAATAGDTVSVDDGNFVGSLNLNKPLSLVSANGAGATTLSGTGIGVITINSDNVQVRGFRVTNPSGKYGISAADHSGLSISENQVADIGVSDLTTSGSNMGISIASYAAAVSDISIFGNVVSNVVANSSGSKTAQAIVVGFSGGNYDVTGVLVASNRISEIISSRGAYGIQLNHATAPLGGKTIAPQILANEISNLSGLWAHAIAFEGNTPNALASCNLIYNINASNPDAVGVMVEDNAFASSVTVESNSFSGVLYGVRNAMTAPINAVGNWWGSLTGPSSATLNPYGYGVGVVGAVAFSPWLSDGTDAHPGTIGFQPGSGLNYQPLKLVFATQPVGAGLNDALTTQPIVAVHDLNGNVTPWANTSVTVELGSNPGSGILAGTTGVLADAGLATYTDLAVTTGGGSGFTLVASASGLDPATSALFDIGNPLPVLASINPAGAVTGSGVGTVSVALSGSGFVPNSVVLVNGSPVTTSFNSDLQLTASLSTSAAGSYSITVSNPPADGGVSVAALTFTVGPTPAIVYVDDDYGVGSSGSHSWGYDAFATITNGIAAVGSGGMVNVAAGNYNEAVSISKPLVLLGADSATPCGGSQSVINAGPSGIAVTIGAMDVTVKGFELQGATGVSDVGFAGAVVQNNKITAGAQGIAMQAINGACTIKDNCITVGAQEISGNPTMGMVLAGLSGSGLQVVEGNNVSGPLYGYLLSDVNGLAINGGTVAGVMQGVAAINYDLAFSAQKSSTFMLNGVSMSDFSGTSTVAARNFHAGVYVFTGGSDPSAQITATVTNVIVDGTGRIAPDSAGLSFADFSTAPGTRQNIVVVNSTIQNNLNRGVNVRGSNAVVSVSQSSISGNGADPFGSGGNNGFGIIARNNSHLTVSESFIVNPATVTSPYSVTALDADADINPLGPVVTVTNCSVLNNSNPSGKLAGQSAGVLNASGNWWGTTDDTTIIAGIAGNVDFTPYLHSGTDIAGDSADGFQGDFSQVHVSIAGTQTGSAARIQEGADVPVATTLFVQPGTFDGNIKITRNNLTVQGAGAGITILDRTTGACAGSYGIALIGGRSAISISDLTIQHFEDGVQMFTGPATGILLEDVELIDNCRHGFWSQAFSLDGLTLRRVNASRNNFGGGASGRGVWIINGEKHNVLIEDGVFNNNGLVGIDISDGNVTDCRVSGNTVSGNGDSGIGILGPQGPGSTLVAFNAVTNNGRFGIEIKNASGNGSATGPVSVVVASNSVVRNIAATDHRDHAGILVIRRGPVSGVNADQPTGVYLTGNAVQGYHRKAGGTNDGFGMVVAGEGHRILNNVAQDCDVAFQVQGGGPVSDTFGLPYFDRDSTASGSALVAGNVNSGNEIGLRVVGATARAVVENNTFIGDTRSGIQVGLGATVDAGDCSAANVTGLGLGSGLNGSSIGGNELTGYGFDAAIAWAIENLNSGGLPAVHADQNLFGAVAPTALADVFSGNVLASQSGPLLITAPANLTVECLSSVPSGATDLVGFGAQGGTASLTVGTVSFADEVATSSINDRIITRTYAVTNNCGEGATAQQIITVDDITAPIVSDWPTNRTLNVNGQCVVSVPNLTVEVSAMDNCGAVHVAQFPAAGAEISLGTNSIVLVVSDDGLNSVTNTVLINVIDTNPAPAFTFVDDSYVGLASGTVVKFPNGGSGADHHIGCDAFSAIQAGIDRVSPGGTVSVAAGTYSEDVSLSKTVNVIGAGAADSIVIGPIGGLGNTFQVGAAGIVLDGFTITRAGNNTNDWGNSALNTAGVAIQGQTANGTIRNCLITGMRTGIDINNANGISVSNNVINDNRTGMIMRNQTDNLIVTGNAITDNWTVGILFLDASSGTGSPVQSAAGCTFSNNNISGNWYGQVVDRQSGGSLPAPGSNLKNFSGNWLGTNSPVITTANSVEPGYAVQIPVEFGGSAVPPGGEPTLAGPAVANIDYTPWLDSGTDTSPAFGFQGDLSTLHVDDSSPQVGSVTRIQEGVNTVSGGTVLIAAGNYSENVSLNSKVILSGAGCSNTLADTIITAANLGLPVISISNTGGTSTGDRLIVRDLRVTGSGAGGVQINADASSCAFIRIENVAAVNNYNGVALAGAGNISDVQVANCVLDNNSNSGLRVASSLPSISTLELSGGHINNNGLLGFSFNPTGTSGQLASGISIDATTFSGNGNAATVGSADVSFFGFNGSASVRNVSINASSSRIAFQLAGQGNGNIPSGWASAGSITVSNLVISGSPSRQCFYISRYSNVSGISLSQVDLTGYSAPMNPANAGFESAMVLENSGTIPLNLADTRFPQVPTNRVALAIWNTSGAIATCDTVFAGAFSPQAKEAAVLDYNDYNLLGDVMFPAFTVNCPAPIVVEATNASGNNVEFIVTATDACASANVTSVPESGSLFPIGTTTVTSLAVDSLGNSNTSSFTVTVVDTTTPTLDLPANSVVTTLQEKDPYATGFATADDAGGTVVITYDDNRSGLTNCNATGEILRTWTATDGAANIASGVQTITVVDTNAPYFTFVPAAISVTNDPGLCSALVNYLQPMARDLGFFQGFENTNWISGNYSNNPSTDWNDYSSLISRVESGTDGIDSRTGEGHAVIHSTALPGAPYDYSGAFCRLGGYSSVFGTGFRAAVDVYLNLSDPAVLANTYGFDLDTATSTQAGGFLRDFIFHAASHTNGNILIGASNNTSGQPRHDLATINHYEVTNSGWYTFEWMFRPNGSGALAVDFNLRDTTGALLWTETRSAPSDLIASVVGGNRYMWFNFIAADKLAIDNTTLERNATVLANPSDYSFDVGTNTVELTTFDACGNSAGTNFTITVNDVEPPTAFVPADIVAVNDSGNCGAIVNFTLALNTDNCGTPESVATPGSGSFFQVGSNQVTVVVSDIHGNTATNSFVVTVKDIELPIATVPADIVVTNDVGNCGAIVTFSLPPALDNCGVIPSVATPASGSTFGIGTNTVTVVATDVHENKGTNTFMIVVNDVEAPWIICPSDIVQAVDIGQSYATVTFSPAAGDNCDIESLVSIPSSGSHFSVGTNAVTVIATDKHGNTNFCSFSVAVVNLPTIVYQPLSRTNNAGTSATFEVAASSPAPLSYHWKKNGIDLDDVGNISGATTTTLVIGNVQDADVAGYSVTLSNFAGTVTSSVATLEVINPPLIVSQPQSVTNQASSSVTFAVTLAGNSTPPFAYQWIKNETNILSDGGNVSGSTTAALTLTNLLAFDQGTYSVLVTNVAGIAISSNATLVVIDPVILTQPLSVTTPLGSLVTFTVHSAGTVPLSYQWQQDGFDLPDETNSTLMILSALDSDQGDYTVEVSNPIGSVLSETATLTLLHPPVITAQPIDIVANLGASALFAVSANGTTPFSYQWQKNLSDLPGATGKELSFSDVTTSDAGSYRVVVTNLDGTATSLPATLTVIVPPTIVSQPLGLTNNAGTWASFGVTTTGTDPIYFWFRNGTNLLTDGNNISGSMSNILTITNVMGADQALYSVIASNQAGIAISSNAILVVNDPIILNQPVSFTTNLNSAATFTVVAFGTAPQYQWLKDGLIIPGALSASYTIPAVAVTDQGAYSVIVSNMYGSVTSAPPAVLTVIDPPIITGQPQSRTNNAGTIATFTVTASGTAPVYHWKKNGFDLVDGGNVSGVSTATLTLNNVQQSDAAAYTVALSNSAGDDVSDPATLNVIDAPILTAQPQSRTNYAGTTASFTVSASGSPASYQWYRNDTNLLVNGVNISGANTPVLVLANVFGADRGGYSVVVSNFAGSITSTNALLTVIDPMISSQPVNLTNRVGTTAVFSVVAVGTAPLKYQWRWQGSDLGGRTNSVLTLTNISDSDAGSYTVVITNVAGSVTSAPALLVTFPPLIVNQPASQMIFLGQPVSFSVDVTGQTPFTYQWQKNGTNLVGATSRILTITHTVATDLGSYRVLVTNPLGIETSESATLTILEQPLLSLLGYTNQVSTLLVKWYPGSNCVLQASSDLLNWTPIRTNVVPFTFVDTDAPLFEKRFYRARSEP